ncbi:MAG: hypothetical protein JRF69_00975 [Deltaproteobacteria bacterium]|nr:hypothetical protein [Deltaproteobacteria bacterium]
MPVEYESDESIDLTIATVKGTPTFDEIVSAVKSFYGGQPTKKVIWNWKGSDPSQLTVIELEQLASFPARYSEHRRGAKTAMVAPDDFSFGISRMFQTFGELNGLPFTLKVFHSMGDAFTWLAEPEK